MQNGSATRPTPQCPGDVFGMGPPRQGTDRIQCINSTIAAISANASNSGNRTIRAIRSISAIGANRSIGSRRVIAANGAILPETCHVNGRVKMPAGPLSANERAALNRTIAVINSKGGVLKTSISANVAGYLASSGFRVLLVDLDPQGNLAEDLGYTGQETDDEGESFARALMLGEQVGPVTAVRQNLDVLVGGPRLDEAVAVLGVKASKDPDGAKLSLARLLAPIAPNYDIILLDCPPGDETLQSAAVAAARYALVPIKSDASSRKGMAGVAARLEGVLTLNPSIDLLGVVLVATGKGATAIQAEARTHVSNLFNSDPDVLFSSTIRHSEAVAQATRERGLLVYELDESVKRAPKWYQVLRGEATASQLAPRTAGSVADDYFNLSQEIVSRITAAEQEEAQSA